jgi:hypothetical protein
MPPHHRTTARPDRPALRDGRAGYSGLPATPRKRWKFWATAYALLILLTGTNLPTPLYRGYEAKFGFSPLVVTLIFASYVAVLIPSLLMAGPLSDAIGRRHMLLPAVALAALGSLAFALAAVTAWLFAARILQGIALGAASGPLTAALAELEPTGTAAKRHWCPRWPPWPVSASDRSWPACSPSTPRLRMSCRSCWSSCCWCPRSQPSWPCRQRTRPGSPS